MPHSSVPNASCIKKRSSCYIHVAKLHTCIATYDDPIESCMPLTINILPGKCTTRLSCSQNNKIIPRNPCMHGRLQTCVKTTCARARMPRDARVVPQGAYSHVLP